jgi:hypothetical protein
MPVPQRREAPDLEQVPREPSLMYREAFLRATAHLGMTREQATSLVQAVSGRRFDDCGWAELEPVIQELQLLLQDLLASPSNRRAQCGR